MYAPKLWNTARKITLWKDWIPATKSPGDVSWKGLNLCTSEQKL
jgi:hypothetical protein